MAQALAQSAEEATMQIRLHPVQRQFFECTKIYKAFTGGIGSGKSWIGCFDTMYNSDPRYPVAVVAPTYGMLEDSTKRSFIEIARMLGLWDDGGHQQTRNIAKLTNGLEVLFRSADDPDKLRGPNLGSVYMDEAGLMKEEAFSILIGRLRAGGKQGRLAATFTPQGQAHWTYRVFADAENPNVALFRCSTKDNIFNSPDYYENLLLQYGKGEGGILRAKQELDGEFVCVKGAEWPTEWFSRDLWFADWPREETQIIRAVALDSSKGTGGKSGDYSVFAKGVLSQGYLYVDFDMDNQRNATKIAEEAIAIQKEFKPHFFGVEMEFGGDVLADDLAIRAENANIMIPLMLIPTGHVQKEVRIRRLTPYFARKIIRFRDTPHTRLAVQMFQSWPHTDHDDAEDALEMLVRLINETGGSLQG